MENSYREVLVQKDIEAKQSFMESVAELFSAFMEEEVTPQQAACILNVIVSAILVVFPVVMPMIIRIIALAWLSVSVWQMKAVNMLDDEEQK